VRQAEVGGGNRFHAGSGFLVVQALDLPPFLCGVVFLGQPHLGPGADGEGVGLRAVDIGNQAVMGLLGPGHPGRALGGIIGDPGKVVGGNGAPLLGRGGVIFRCFGFFA